MSRLFLIGLTGPTGSGKSSVAQQLSDSGALWIDCDGIARQVVQKGTPGLAALCRAFSDQILAPDGTLDRKALARLAFATPQQTKRLNAITHPLILQEISRILKEQQSRGGLAVLDAPLLFEAGLDRICDATIAVVAPAKARLTRIMARDGLTQEEAQRRMDAQPDLSYYQQRADYLIENDTTPQALACQVKQMESILRRIADETPQKMD